MSSTNSIFLPFVYDNLNEEYIRGVFESAGIGEVERIDFVAKRNPDSNNCKVYVHFKSRGLSQSFLEEGVYCESVSSPAALAAIAGGGTAGVINAGTATIRATSSLFTGGLGNFVVSTLELIAAFALSILAFLLPMFAAVLGVILAIILFRFAIGFFSRKKDVKTAVAG